MATIGWGSTLLTKAEVVWPLIVLERDVYRGAGVLGLTSGRLIHGYNDRKPRELAQ